MQEHVAAMMGSPLAAHAKEGESKKGSKGVKVLEKVRGPKGATSWVVCEFGCVSSVCMYMCVCVCVSAAVAVYLSVQS